MEEELRKEIEESIKETENNIKKFEEIIPTKTGEERNEWISILVDLKEYKNLLEKRIKKTAIDKINSKDYYGRQFWIIDLPEWGSFAYYGTEQEAEQRRKDKANWEQAIATKRLATDSKKDCALIERDC